MKGIYRLEKMGVDTSNRGTSTVVPQYIAALAVCLGSVAAGAVLGWTSNLDLAKDKLNDIEVNEEINGWIGSFCNIGAMLVCFPIGYICDMIGRKWACLMQIIPFSIGWLLVIFANSTSMIYAGRFFTGLAGGAFCVVAPIYTSEIAEKEVRGSLGSYFQLLLTIGVLIGNIGGAYMKPVALCILSACIPLVFGAVFFFQPETPVYLLKKGKKEEARKSLQRLRGSRYNCDIELKEIEDRLQEEAAMKVSFFEAVKTRASKKALFICFGLMFFQQMSGVNAVIFFTRDIFESAGGSIDPKLGTIYFGVAQVVATFVSSLIVDKFGRKALLIFSDVFMVLSGTALGIFFTLKNRQLVDDETISNIGFIPIASMMIFIIAFSLGFGPIPWHASAEIMPPEIKSVAVSSAATFNWFLAFIVTKFFKNLKEGIGGDSTFYAFSVISVLGTMFVIFFVPETKGKTIQEVQDMLNGNKTSKRDNMDK